VSTVRRILKRTGVVACVTLLAFLAAKAFVGDVYRVGSSSMEPTLFPGEWVFVLFDKSPPKRFDLVTLTRGDEAIVKRVAGLPGESVAIDPGGDLLIDGARLPKDAPRPEPILVFDSHRAKIADHFRMGSSTSNPWREVDGVFELDARSIAPHEGVGLMGLAKGLQDDHLSEEGSLVRNEPPIDVGDAILECAFRPLESGGRIVIALDEQGDVFRFTVEIEPAGAGRARLTRLLCGDANSEEDLASADLALPIGEWTLLRASNLDNHLALESHGKVVLEADYAENRLHPRDDASLGRSYGERVRLGGEGAHLQIRDLKVWRDLHYVAPPDAATHRKTVSLRNDEYYLLGDHSRASSDSREWGAVPGSSLFGRPRWVVWPPRAIRTLHSVAPLTPAPH
jgi:signal peptidase I